MTRCIGILGTSFCGSTALCRILDGLPGVAGVGETHVVADGPEGQGKCNDCGPSCSVIAEQLLADLRGAARGQWWELWGAATGADVVVSSDKWIGIYDRLSDRPDHALILYRDPVAWVVSWMHHKAVLYADITLGELAPLPRIIVEAAHTWERFYREALQWCEGYGVPWLACDFADVVAGGERELRRLCEGLDLTYRPEALDYKKTRHHDIMGNNFVQPRRRAAQKKQRPRYIAEKEKHLTTALARDDRWREVFTDEQAQKILNDDRVADVLTRLRRTS